MKVVNVRVEGAMCVANNCRMVFSKYGLRGAFGWRITCPQCLRDYFFDHKAKDEWALVDEQGKVRILTQGHKQTKQHKEALKKIYAENKRILQARDR